MTNPFSTIWDGLAYRQVSAEEATRLVAEDKAQDLTGKLHSALDLKFRHQFTGYQTREIRAETKQPGLAPVPPKTPAKLPAEGEEDQAAAKEKVSEKPKAEQKPADKPAAKPKAEQKPADKPAAKPKAEQKPADVNPDWKAHRKAAADKLGKPFNQVTKREVQKYMEKELGLGKS